MTDQNCALHYPGTRWWQFDSLTHTSASAYYGKELRQDASIREQVCQIMKGDGEAFVRRCRCLDRELGHV